MQTRNLIDRAKWDDFYSSNVDRSRASRNSPYDIWTFDTKWVRTILDALPASRSDVGNLCEIGCGDGRLVSKIGKLLGLKTYGIEFSFEAAAAARSRGVEVACMDALTFSGVDQERFRKFDVVFSYGFAEHFWPVMPAISLHSALVRRGGVIVIQAPRLIGWNWIRFRVLRPDLLRHHVFEIMNSERLSHHLEAAGLRVLHCEYYGIMKFRLPVDVRHWSHPLNLVLLRIDSWFARPLRWVSSRWQLDTWFFSPNIIAICSRDDK